MSQAQPQLPAGTAQPAARCPGRTEHDEEQGSCPGFTSTRFAPEHFAAGRVELVWVRRRLLRALRTCGGLWGAEPLLRGRIPRTTSASRENSTVSPAKAFPLQLKVFDRFWSTCSPIHPELCFCIPFCLLHL